MSIIRYTKTATFLFPLLEIPKSLFMCDVKDIFEKTKFRLRFLNAYIQDEQVDDFKEKHIFIVLRNYRDIGFDTFYDKLVNFPNYVDDYEDNDCLIMIFSIPEKNIKDYLLLLNGRYSLIEENTKQLIINNHFSNDKLLLIKMILYKSKELKEFWNERLSCYPNSIVDIGDQEVCSRINLEKQILSKDVLKKYINNNLSIKGRY